MRVERIRTSPDPYGPYLLSQGLAVGDLLFISGQAGYTAAGPIVEVRALHTPEAMAEIEAIAPRSAAREG